MRLHAQRSQSSDILHHSWLRGAMLHLPCLSCHKHLVRSLRRWCSRQHECCRCGPQHNLQHRGVVREKYTYARQHICAHLKALLLQDAACLLQRMR